MKDAVTVLARVDTNEGEAIARAQRGDGVGFEYLYKTYSRRVYSVCLRMTRNPAEAEDMTQQTFLQVFRKIGTFRGESGFSTWLHRVTVNVVLMHLRRKGPSETLFEGLDRPGSDSESRPEYGASDTSMLGGDRPA
jgi:RNA polymerase sigma-70 factor (ECF subfamily)